VSTVLYETANVKRRGLAKTVGRAHVVRGGDLPYFTNTEDKTCVKDEIAYIEIKTKLLMKSKKKIVACNLKCTWANQLFTKTVRYVRKKLCEIYRVRQNSLSELLQLYLRSR
jgi:Glu-tRNA(Gln) amidotransferase subunit E-like FAD-binding protein